MAKAGLCLNPTSAELWNTLGDSQFELEQLEEARQSYLRALRINDSDVRARFNLACRHRLGRL
jgi:Flp pilus assembly protein TadD